MDAVALRPEAGERLSPTTAPVLLTATGGGDVRVVT
jgi:hypothetical protein